MEFWDFASLATVVGCATAVVITFMNRVFSPRSKERQHELRMLQERAEQQEQRIVDLSRQNELLHDQLEWHNRLLAAQERMLGQGSAEVPASRGSANGASRR